MTFTGENEELPAHPIGERWQLLRQLGKGGMGAVFAARHVLTKDTVAVKVLYAKATKDPVAIERFQREVSFAAAIGHPGIVKVLDAGVDRTTGWLYLAMELLEGETLGDRLDRPQGRPLPSAALRIIHELLEPLAAAHAAGIVHRDLKPHNVFIVRKPDGTEHVKLLDFGLARDDDNNSATVTGTSVGTPSYMAPEQAMSARGVAATADVWAVGVMIYEAIYGAPPFIGETPHAVIVLSCTKPHLPLRDAAPGVPPSLSALVDACLSKEPAARPQNGADLRTRLTPILDELRASDLSIPPAVVRSSASGSPSISAVSAAKTTVAPRRRRSLGCILGGVLGGIVGFVALAAVAILAVRAYRISNRRTVARPTVAPTVVTANNATAANIVPVAPPRQIWPRHGARVSSRRPRLRFALAASSEGVEIELCRDRACSDRIMGWNASGTTAAPDRDLPVGLVFWRLRSRRGNAVGDRTSSTRMFFVPPRDAPRANAFGISTDVNADGELDVGVAAPDANTRDGEVIIYAGSRSGPGQGEAARLVGTLGGAHERTGASIAAVGDVNGDGYSDVAVGAPESSAGAGLVTVYLGGTAAYRLPPWASNSRDARRFGAAVAGAGDIDADGYDDLIVGAPDTGDRAGSIYILRGSPEALLGASGMAGVDGPGAELGGAVAGAGDVNADGYADLLAGAPGAENGTGRVYLFLGGPNPQTPILFRSPNVPSGRLGASLAGNMDVNGDGFSDVAVGAPNAGRVFVIFGETEGLSRPTLITSPETGNIQFGAAVALADLNGDGFADAAIGAPGARNGLGCVFLYRGSANGVATTPEPTPFCGVGAGSAAGTALARAGDLDHDNREDLTIGAPGVVTNTGYAYVLFGAEHAFGSLFPTLRGTGATGGRFGSSVL